LNVFASKDERNWWDSAWYLPPTALTILERYPSSGLLHPILQLFFLRNDQDDSKHDEASETPPATSLIFLLFRQHWGCFEAILTMPSLCRKETKSTDALV